MTGTLGRVDSVSLKYKDRGRVNKVNIHEGFSSEKMSWEKGRGGNVAFFESCLPVYVTSLEPKTS